MAPPGVLTPLRGAACAALGAALVHWALHEGQEAGVQSALARVPWPELDKKGLTSSPELWTDTPAAAWPALERWADGEYLGHLAAAASTKLQVKVNESRFFHVGCCPMYPLDVAAFLESARSRRGNLSYYFSGALSLLGDSWAADVSPHNWTAVGLASYDDAQYGSTNNIWIGSAGATTPLHNDHFHNVYVQVLGRKRVSLVPADAWRDVYPHSSLSVRFRQSQLAFDGASPVPAAPERFPRFAALQRQVVELQPGDVLYIPPLWFHQIEALSFAVAVNFWTEDELLTGMTAAAEAPPPLAENLEADGAADVDLVVAATVAALAAVAGKLNGGDARAALRHLAREHLEAKVWPQFNGSDVARCSGCHPADPHVLTHERELRQLAELSYLPPQRALAACRQGFASLDRLLLDEDVQRYVEHISGPFLRAPPDISAYMLGNFVEGQLANFVGDSAATALMEQCLVLDGPPP